MLTPAITNFQNEVLVGSRSEKTKGEFNVGIILKTRFSMLDKTGIQRGL
jgi:hypothetical protein